MEGWRDTGRKRRREGRRDGGTEGRREREGGTEEREGRVCMQEKKIGERERGESLRVRVGIVVNGQKD